MKTVEEIIKKINDWKAPNIREVKKVWANQAESKGKHFSPASGHHWEQINDIPPFDIYVYLKARFGNPNGFQMILKRQKTTDNLIHWEYHLEFENHLILFTGFLFNFSILISKIDKKCPDERTLFLEALKRDFSNYKTEIKRVRNEIEKWNLFINPYFHLSQMVEDNFEELSKLEVKPPSLKSPTNLKDMEDLKSANDNLHEAFSHGMILKIITPIWIESFVNLIIFLLAKPEIKKDQERFKKIQRKKVLEKILLLHEVCEGFKEEIRESELVDIKKLFKIRNRFLHGGIALNISSGESIFYDERYIPLFAKQTSGPGFLQNLLLGEVSVEKIDKEITVGENLLSLILGKLTPPAGRSLIQLMGESILGWDNKRKIPGGVLPPVLCDVLTAT
ncbi:MAG: hypothetical protein Tsb005_03320 [Gammaproteobacteria bacterium]